MIVNAGIIGVSYSTPYRVHDGMDLLLAAGVTVTQLTYTDLE